MIVAKILAIRLSTSMAYIIGDYQPAAVKGRQIQDNMLVVNEIINSQIRSKKLGMILKLDFYKAFDCIAWEYIDYMMERMGFGQK